MSENKSTQTQERKDCFEIGGEDLLAKATVNNRVEEIMADESSRKREELLEDIRFRVGTLLKTETVSLLLGAGASVECGGPLIGSVPISIEKELQSKGIAGNDKPRIRRWLTLFYLAVRYCGADDSPITRQKILERKQILERWGERNGNNAAPLAANFEQVLAKLHLWRSALPAAGGRLRIDGLPPVDAKAEDLDEALRNAKHALAAKCVLPRAGKETQLTTHKTLLRKLLARPLNLKRVNIFTLNYDTLVEQAADAEGIVLIDGFIGTQRRVFRPESYEQDLYFPAETTEGRVHRFDRVLHLYKLHGSITWQAREPTIDNPYGVESAPFDPKSESLLIYPTPAKYGETLGLPYSELFRRFASALTRHQSVLFVIGYGFGDEHVNAIIRQALAIPSFTLVIVDPEPKSQFVQTLRAQKDRRVWISEGPSLGTLSGFVEHVLPDLQDEEIRKRVLATVRALSKDSSPHGDSTDAD